MANGDEIVLENNIRDIIKTIIGSSNDFILLENKDVTDIIICRNIAPKIFFIEVKHYSEANGRIGFGNSDGSGFQPEILTKRPEIFETNLRWVFGKDNDEHYYILTNEDCQRYFAGGTIGRKQNNFQKNLFREMPSYTEQEFCNYIKNWINDND
jgi:hypothetical protein